MSIRATSLVWERTRAKGSNLLMLLAIADYAKDDGRWAYAAARTLTRKSRLTGRGGELVLQKLVADGEVLPEWVASEQRLFLHVRCIMDWLAYQTEGPPPAYCEKISRSQSEKFSLKLIALAVRKANERAATAKTAAATAKTAAATAKTAAGSLLSGSEGSEGSEGSQEQGLRPDLPPVDAVENPEENIRVITRIVHEVLDLYAAADDVTEADVIETVKRHCAQLGIAYQSDVVWRALESAVVQRKRIGKPSLLAGSR